MFAVPIDAVFVNRLPWRHISPSPWRQAKAFAHIILALAPVVASKAVNAKTVCSRLHRKRAISWRMAGTRTQKLSTREFATENGTQSSQISRLIHAHSSPLLLVFVGLKCWCRSQQCPQGY